MAQTRRRTHYWLTDTNKWFVREGNENEVQAKARYNAAPNIGIDNPQGTIVDGQVEVHNTSVIKGWAIDPNADNLTPTVSISINGEIVKRLLCTIARPDISDRYGITGFNTYGFEWTVPAGLNVANNTLRVTLNNRNEDFIGSPTVLDQLASTTTLPIDPVPTAGADYVGGLSNPIVYSV